MITMSLNRILLLLVLGGLVVPVAAPASAGNGENPAEKARRAGEELSLSEIAKATDAACGTKIAARIDWKSFGADFEGRSVSSYCGAPLEALQGLCKGKHARAHIRARVRSFTCRQAPSGKSALSPKKGALEWNIAADAVNVESFARAELLRKL